MKLNICLTILAVALAASSRITAQEDAATRAAAVAARQDAEDRYKRLNSAIEDLQTAHISQQKKIAVVLDNMDSLREEQIKAAGRASASKEDIRRLSKDLQDLAKAIQEIDRKREEDKKLILDKIRDLANIPVPEVPKPVIVKPDPAPPVKPATPQKWYEYEVKQGDTLTAIVEAYRQSGVKVTHEQVLKANPKLNPAKLKVGQKITIPEPGAAGGNP
jgi:LysM repeat protein